MQGSNESFLNGRRVVIALLLRSLFQNERERASSYFFRTIPVATRGKNCRSAGRVNVSLISGVASERIERSARMEKHYLSDATLRYP